jgi:hypothetical protein
MTKITADQLARQGRAAFVTATHTLRGKSGKESPGDKSFIRAKGIRFDENRRAIEFQRSLRRRTRHRRPVL